MKKLAIAVIMLALLGVSACSKKAATTTAKTPYCTRAQAVENKGRVLNDESIFGDPTRLETALTELLAAVEGIAAEVPADIKADYEKGRQALSSLVAELRKIGWDISKAGPTLQALFADQEIQAASDRVDAYHTRTCPGFVLADQEPSAAPSS